MTLPSAPPPHVEGPYGMSPVPAALVQPVFSPPESAEAPRFTVRDALQVLFRHRWLILITSAVVTLAVTIATLAVPRYYTASATVLLRPETDNSPSYFSGVGVEERTTLIDPVARRMETEMAIIGTEPLASSVVQQLGLTYDQVYTPPLAVIARPIVVVADWIAPVFGVHPADPKGFRRTVENFQKGMTVEPVPGKSPESAPTMVIVKLKAPSAALARDALAKLLDDYIHLQDSLAHRAGAGALDAIRTEVNEALAEVTAAESSLRAFMASSNYTGVAAGDGSRAMVGPDAPISGPGDDRSLVQLKSQLLARETELAEARQTYTPDAEPVQRLERIIAALQQRLARESRVNADNQALYFEKVRRLKIAETRLTELQAREAQIAFSVSVSAEATGNRVIVEPPLLPDSSDWKRRAAIIVLGAFLGVVAALGLAGLSEMMNDTLTTKYAAWRALGLPVIGSLPDALLSDDREPAAQRLAEKLIELVSHPVPGRVTRGRVVVVTSARAGEGKTTVAIDLARALTEMGAGATLLIDAHLADPAVSTHYGLGNAPGLSDALHDGSGLDGRVHLPKQFSVLPAGTRRVPALLLVPSGLARVLADVCQRHALVIVDAGPISSGFAARIADQADAMVLVVAAGRTPRAVIADAIAPIPAELRRRAVVVLNRAKFAIPRFVYERI